MTDVRGLTIALNTGVSDEVLSFYSTLFGRSPDTAPMDNFLEWQICPGAWLQLSTGHDRPGANNARVRLEVDDVAAAVARMAQAGVPIGDVVTVPDVVAFANFSDHWGNALGFYQLLSPRNILTEAQRRRDARERAEAAAEPDRSPLGDRPVSPEDDAPNVEAGEPGHFGETSPRG